jgi:hypothetical protein
MDSPIKKVEKHLISNKKGLQEIFVVCKRIGTSLNRPTNRFEKSTWIDTTCKLCIPGMEYLDERGYDHLYEGIRISNKTQVKIFPPNKDRTSEITLVNTQRSKWDPAGKIERNFDILLLIQTKFPFAVGLVTYEDAMKGSFSTPDKIKTVISRKDIKFIISPDEEVDVEVPDDGFDFAEERRKYMNKTIRKCIGK